MKERTKTQTEQKVNYEININYRIETEILQKKILLLCITPFSIRKQRKSRPNSASNTASIFRICRRRV